jgi:hypothetical protein
MESEKKVIINTKTIEIQIKKVLQALVNEFVVSKENVTIIDFAADGTEKVAPIKEHLEIDLDLLKNKITKEYNSFKQIIEKLSNSKIKDFEINNNCYTENFADIITLINSIYDCQFKKIVDNLNISEQDSYTSFSILNFLKNNKLTLLIVIIIVFTIAIKYYYKK